LKRSASHSTAPAKVELLGLAHERDHVALRAAAEAVVELLDRVHRKARRALLVERASPDVSRPGLAQLRAAADDATTSDAAFTSSTDVSLISAIATQLRDVCECEPVGHAGDEVDDLLRLLPARDEVLEDASNRGARAFLLEPRVRAEVDALEHERPQCEHRTADLRALDDVARSLRALDEIVHERVDAVGAVLAEQRHVVVRQIGRVEDAEADGVVDVVVDVRDAVDDADDLALERCGLLLAGVGQDPVAHLGREVERFRDLQRMLVVAEASAEVLLQRLVERVLAGVPNGGWPMSWPRPIASTRSSLSRSARATPRAIAVVSSVCVMRVR
jgi:hypothetical protein